jgi:hypothetical protein
VAEQSHGQQSFLVGSTSGDEIRLSRKVSLQGNVFKPFFFGRFSSEKTYTKLTGKFSMHPLTVASLAVTEGLFIGIVELKKLSGG